MERSASARLPLGRLLLIRLSRIRLLTFVEGDETFLFGYLKPTTIDESV